MNETHLDPTDKKPLCAPIVRYGADLVATHARHHDVQKDEIRESGAGVQVLQRSVAAHGLDDVVAVRLEQHVDDRLVDHVIVH